MPEITKKRISEILRSAFDLLWFEPQGLYVREILDHISKNLDLSEYERGYPSFAPRFPRYEVIIRIGSIPLVKAGWLVKTNKGRWYLTEKGRQASKQFQGAEEFFIKAVQYYEDWQDQEDAKLDKFDFLLQHRAEERSWEQIQQYLQSMPPPEFRDLVCELLKGLGYELSWIAPAEKDNGLVDIIATADPAGANGRRILVHLNHTGQAATLEGLRSFAATLAENDNGIYVSTGGFTSNVRDDSYFNAYPNLNLVDLDELVELWLKSLEKLSPQARERLPLKPVYFLSLPEQ